MAKEIKECIAAYKDGKLVGYFTTRALAAEVLKVDRSHITKVLNGKRSHTGGYGFKIVKTNDIIADVKFDVVIKEEVKERKGKFFVIHKDSKSLIKSFNNNWKETQNDLKEYIQHYEDNKYQTFLFHCGIFDYGTFLGHDGEYIIEFSEDSVSRLLKEYERDAKETDYKFFVYIDNIYTRGFSANTDSIRDLVTYLNSMELDDESMTGVYSNRDFNEVATLGERWVKRIEDSTRLVKIEFNPESLPCIKESVVVFNAERLVPIGQYATFDDIPECWTPSDKNFTPFIYFDNNISKYNETVYGNFFVKTYKRYDIVDLDKVIEEEKAVLIENINKPKTIEGLIAEGEQILSDNEEFLGWLKGELEKGEPMVINSRPLEDVNELSDNVNVNDYQTLEKKEENVMTYQDKVISVEEYNELWKPKMEEANERRITLNDENVNSNVDLEPSIDIISNATACYAIEDIKVNKEDNLFDEFVSEYVDVVQPKDRRNIFIKVSAPLIQLAIQDLRLNGLDVLCKHVLVKRLPDDTGILVVVKDNDGNPLYAFTFDLTQDTTIASEQELSISFTYKVKQFKSFTTNGKGDSFEEINDVIEAVNRVTDYLKNSAINL